MSLHTSSTYYTYAFLYGGTKWLDYTWTNLMLLNWAPLFQKIVVCLLHVLELYWISKQ